MTPDQKLDKILEMQTSQAERLEFLSNRFTELDEVLTGNERYGRKGLIERIEDTEKYIQADKNVKLKMSGGVAVIMALGGALIWLINKLWT